MKSIYEWSPIKSGTVAFGFVCFMGFFCSLAGGVTWGTAGCGVVCFITLSFACVVGLIAAMKHDFDRDR